MNQRLRTSLWIVLSFTPSYAWYVKRMMDGGEEALSVIFIPLAIYFSRSIECKESRGDWISLAGVTLYALCWLFHLPAMIKAILAITILLRHFGVLRNCGVSALAYLALPWLSSLQFFLGYPLRILVAQMSGAFLNVFGVGVEAEGTGLIYQSQHVFVDPPCSGVNMLWSGLILSAILSVFFRLSWVKSVLLYFLAGIILIMVNAIRGSILFFPESKLVEWPEWTHEGLGLLLYGLCLYVLISLTQKLSPGKGHV